ncbi:MAG TPA: deoxyribose-phosphate aldolase [Candidatus Tidjanibacter faecipullorum]|uniref:Deoxyribose-phosphate aldolase n=1 Tax=Candidatus Tidjanibacter faecipullorum TaxID=2838766 RepID=A0A9D2DDT7_9BACT|nr:deoxyribose-phosphate aldolase [Candidatus Tidjanibacter faecipullorum]
MEYAALLEKYTPVASDDLVKSIVAKAKAEMDRNRNEEVYKFCFGALDLTTLNNNDSVRSVAEFVKKAVDVPTRFPNVPNVSSICVYPSFVDIVGLGVEGTDIAVTSVAGGFPTAQTFLEVKMLEVAMAVENGADEIDVVMNAGEMVEGDFDRLANDLEMLCNEAGKEVIFKVIIESGMLTKPEEVYRASLLAILSGADFVKTSTGKSAYGATPKSVMVICNAIKDYYLQTGINVGIKIAGGVRTVDDAVLYYTLVENLLGREWLTPSLFRFGASAPLANALLSAITGEEQHYF